MKQENLRKIGDNNPLDNECIVGDDYDCYDCKFFREENGTVEFCMIKDILGELYND